MKQVWKKIISVVCMAALIVAGIGVIPELQAKAEEAPAGLTEVGWTDLGFTDDAVIRYNESGWGTTDKTITGKSFVNSTFRGEVQFQKTAGQNMWIQFGGSFNTLNNKGIRVTVLDNGNLKLYDMISNPDIQLAEVTPSAAGLPDGSTFLDTKFELGLDLWQPEGTNDLKVNLYINGTRYNDQAYVVTDGANGMETTIDFMVANENDSITLTLPREKAPEGLTSVKWADFGFVEDFILTESNNWGIRDQALSGKNTVNSSFRGKVEFQRTNSGNMWIQYGSNIDNSGSKGLRVTLATDGTLKIYDMVHGGEELDIVYPAKTNLGEGNTFSNTEFELGIDLWTSGESDAKIIIYINGIQYNRTAYTITGGASSMLNYVDIVGQGTGNFVTIRPDMQSAPEGLTKIGWNDLGITDDKTYTTNGALSTISSTVGLTDISFRGKVQFNGTDQPTVIFGANTDWGGLWIKTNGNNLQIIVVDGSWKVNKTITAAQVKNTEMESFANTEFELGLDIWAEGNDIKVLVFVNGEQMNAAPYVWESGVSAFTDKVVAYTPSSSSVTIIPEIEVETSPEGLTKIGWKDLGLEEKEYTYTNGGFSAIGRSSTVTLKNASFRGVVKFNGTGTALTYGDNRDGWQLGLNFIPTTNGELRVWNRSDTSSDVLDVNLNPSTAGIPSFLNQEFELGIDSWVEGTDIKFNLFVNGKQYNSNAYIWKEGVSSQFLYNHLTVGLLVTAETDSITVEFPEEDAIDLDKEPAGYLLTGATICVNGKKANNGDTLTTAGDYHVVVWDATNVTVTNVGCYKAGDTHVDGSFDIRDVIATKKEIKKVTDGTAYSSVSRYYAADVNGDHSYNLTDMEWIRNKILGVTNVTPNLVAAYSLTSDPLEMPIGGFNGPYVATDGTNLLTDAVYQKIADCGINFITFTRHSYPTDSTKTERINIIESQLKLAEKYKLGMFVQDEHIQHSTEKWTKDALANRIKWYSNYKSFLGLSIFDEPTLTGVYGSSEDGAGDAFHTRKSVSKLTNSFSNIAAYANMLPLNATMKLDASVTDEEAYRTYLTTYCEEYNPKFLSYDNYPFEWKQNAITGTSAKADYYYFKNLAIVREIANQYQIPFWTHVQSGDSFDQGAGGTNAHNPSEGKFKWQINVELAFGAKGIQYFPLVQPDGYELTANGESDYTRNGLIGKNGVETEWYAYAKAMNQQIKSMDHVLMNSVNKGIMAYGTYATTNINAANTCSNVKLDSFALGGDNPTITGLSSTNSEYGAIAGCFDYQGKTAVYVVNYDVTSQQDITLYFNNARVYYRVGSTAFKTAMDTYCTVSLGAGEAALIVFDYAPN